MNFMHKQVDDDDDDNDNNCNYNNTHHLKSLISCLK